ncbi:MAG: adenosyl-hopene transferase HpnH [Alphaproteobacteria bacterium]|nr:adenosyl-hopene transferase HpnH [Alphaproteobacteria bacterium]
MAVPLIQQARVGAYVLKQKLRGNRRYPLVLMLEPLFRCNLACSGCGKIAYPDEVLNKRLGVQECLDAADECGAPIVSIPGGEPLLHKEIEQIVEGLVARRKFVYLCTNALLLEKRLDGFRPSPYLTLSVHLDGDRDHHDRSVAQEGVFDRAVAAIRAARERGFRVNINCTLFDDGDPKAMADFFTFTCKDLGIEGITVSPGFAYEKAPTQEKFLSRPRTRELFRTLFRLGKGKGWVFSQSSLFLDFLAGNQTYQCTPWGNPTRNVFGWQRPCYLLDKGHARTFRELMETTDWDAYGLGRNGECDNCMMHCGFEPTAVIDTIDHPLKALRVAVAGVRTEGPMAPDLPD